MKIDLCKLKEYKPELILDSCCRRAAVCIPLIRNENGYDVLFELRSGEIEDQPGDVCFPGGMIESGEVPSEAAIRECCEELLIERDSIELLGASDYFHSYNVTVYPFAVELKDYAFSYSPDEVSSVFTVPLSYFMDNEPDIYNLEWKAVTSDEFPYDLIRGGKNYRWRKQVQEEPFYVIENRVIWGITAKLICGFSHIIKNYYLQIQ